MTIEPPPHRGATQRLQPLLRAWQAFWHPEGYTLTLGLFRVLFAACLFFEVRTTRAKSLFAITGGFHLPYPAVPSFIHPISVQTYQLVHAVEYSLIALLAVGLFMRPAILGLLVLQGYIFFSDSLNFRNHPYFFLLVLVALLFSPADEALSLKAIQKMDRTRGGLFDALIGPIRSLTFQRVIMVQFCLIYLLAGMQKLNPSFLSGALLADELGPAAHAWGTWQFLLPGGTSVRFYEIILNHGALVAGAMITLAVEFTLPFTLWFSKTRPISILLGIGFHLAILILMGITQFSYAMLSCYLLFLKPETLPALATEWVRHSRVPGGTTPR
jgi:hypothetical protein